LERSSALNLPLGQRKPPPVVPSRYCSHSLAFEVPPLRKKLKLGEAFASRNRPVYGQAFDAVHSAVEVDLNDVADIKRQLRHITLYEVKATNRAGARDDFSGHFLA
jgi:hypothetical protein